MPTIHTLGPVTTDSYQAAEHLQDEDPAYQGLAIETHPDFESVYQNLAAYAGDYFLVPTAYQNKDGNNWTNNHYRYLDRLQIATVFHLPTLPMLLTENKSVTNGKAILHAATKELIQQFMKVTDQDLQVDYVPSKPLAQTAFEAGDYQYAIFSKQSFVPHGDLKIIKEYHPEMVWCLYQIK
ncbi:hypothetical protein [Fructobacillus ficulneus]|uniref:Prephenate dehydratase n=1 Tax=Fructobacillus ficulneus TaxID=157463 RepID=A0A0K8MGE1_9LACO|nr:hypothetical protein [Fructobacillus ficulneus]GAO99522.1 hypothetical protein FFIC_230060 [Fructobacillus ficulneus]